MAKKRQESGALKRLKTALASGTPAPAYLFYGPEVYLRDWYLDRLRKLLVPEATAAFDSHRAEGKGLTVQRLAEMVEAMPMGAERTLTVVTDWDLYRLPEDQRTALIALLGDLPPWCCLVFVYDTIEYKPNRSMKKLYQAVSEHVETVELLPLSASDLTAWIARRFRALGKEIDRRTAEHLIFTCGELMTGLAQEIAKIGSYAPGGRITVEDIDAVADPVLSRRTFDLCGAVSAGRDDEAAAVLGDLLEMQVETPLILGALGLELRRIWTARLALDSGRDRAWIEELWGLKAWQSRPLWEAARRTDATWCAAAVEACASLDRRMKSGSGLDGAEGLASLLVGLSMGRRRRS